MIKLEAKRFELNFLLKLSDLKSNLSLALSYLNPALNNPGLDSRSGGLGSSPNSGSWPRHFTLTVPLSSQKK